MSSCCGSVCLLVLLGVVLAIGSPLHSNSEELKDHHESIANILNLKRPEISTRPLFNSVIHSINTSCQRKEELQLMNATLDVYMRIFSSVLKHSNNPQTPTLLDQFPQAESDLKNLQEKTEKMKTRLDNLSQLNHNKEDVLCKLNSIKVDDHEVQKRALAQFREVYRAASVIDRRCGPAHSSA
ncbi:interferon gamma 1 [Labrus bergylta]|uniref:Interferon gamma 1-like n=1 Tax=Labrus bergylta TaxID=56723 RepID=A0A3Q3FDH6_9LABR|nr:interferon gamma 1-like [Labrus bergylta]